MISDEWKAIEAKYYMHVVNRQPIVVEQGLGARVWDVDGKEYLDFTAGWAVNNLGHCHPVVTKAIQDQAATLVQTSNQYYTLPQLRLAEILIEQSCMDRVFFCNSGAEANEGAVKLARKYGRTHRGGAQEVITTINSFHGRTVAMIAATGQPHYQEAWLPMTPGFINVAYDDLDEIKRVTTDQTCAVMVEVVQGEGGVNIPTEGYLQGLRDWCDSNGLLLIFDEVQTGMGRLGSLFGYEVFGVEPDVMTLAKALGNGAPIGAFLSKEHCAVLEPGDHGSTFGGNALTTAAANASVRYMIQYNIPKYARQKGTYLLSSMNWLQSQFPDSITNVRGVGLLLAIQFDDTIAAKVVGACNDEGLLINAVRPNTIRLMPPLVITEGDIDEAISRLNKSLHSVLAK